MQRSHDILYDLPYEILYNILTALPIHDLINTCYTSSYGSQICKDELLWRDLSCNKYGIREKIH